MGIFLILVVLIVVGVIIYQFEDSLSLVMILSGSLFLIACLLIVFILYAYVPGEVVDYTTVESTVESYESADFISGEERAMLVEKVIDTNNSILTYRRYRKSFFFNVFNPKVLCELELIDIGRIPEAMTQATLAE